MSGGPLPWPDEIQDREPQPLPHYVERFIKGRVSDAGFWFMSLIAVGRHEAKQQGRQLVLDDHDPDVRLAQAYERLMEASESEHPEWDFLLQDFLPLLRKAIPSNEPMQLNMTEDEIRKANETRWLNVFGGQLLNDRGKQILSNAIADVVRYRNEVWQYYKLRYGEEDPRTQDASRTTRAMMWLSKIIDPDKRGSLTVRDWPYYGLD